MLDYELKLVSHLRSAIKNIIVPEPKNNEKLLSVSCNKAQNLCVNINRIGVMGGYQ